jgi:hypothetical protein
MSIFGHFPSRAIEFWRHLCDVMGLRFTRDDELIKHYVVYWFTNSLSYFTIYFLYSLHYRKMKMSSNQHKQKYNAAIKR